MNFNYQIFYEDWIYEMRCGFNILLYGVGSKKFILNDFISKTNVKYIELNGLAKHIENEFVGAINSLLSTSFTVSNVKNAFSTFKKTKHTKQLYFIVHSIDSIPRDSLIFEYILELLSYQHINIIASMDKKDAYMWDELDCSWDKWNWVFHHTPTFIPFVKQDELICIANESTDVSQTLERYFNINNNHVLSQLFLATDSLSSIPSSLEGKTDDFMLQLLSLERIYASLTANSKKIFDMFIDVMQQKTALQHADDTTATKNSVVFNDFLMLCREEFLVSNETGLRTHLREFIDHSIINLTTDENGINMIQNLIPIQIMTEFRAANLNKTNN